MSLRMLPVGIAIVGAVFFVGFGLWAFFGAQSFFDSVATFEPYNEHFIHDIGAFQIGLGAALALAAWRRADALMAVLAGAEIGSAVHAAAHLQDHHLGGKDSDAVIFGLVAIVLLAGAALRLRAQAL